MFTSIYKKGYKTSLMDMLIDVQVFLLGLLHHILQLLFKLRQERRHRALVDFSRSLKWHITLFAVFAL